MMSQDICVVGLGYVGWPLAFLCAKKGYSVIGLENDQRVVDEINQGLFQNNDIEQGRRRLPTATRSQL